MPFGLIQAGSALQLVDGSGVLTSLTIPSTITLRDDVPPRWAVSGRYVVLVNTPSQPLTIDVAGTVRPLTPRAPRIGPTVAAGSAGSLSGTYAGLRYTFITKDALGNTVSESDFSPAGGTVTIASKKLRVSSLDLSPDLISARRIYRPTTNGSTLFPWIELDGNTLTSIEDDLSDAGLELVAAPVLGAPPRLTLIAEFRGRLWGVGDLNIDTVVYSEAGVNYAWPGSNSLPIPHLGSDERGITAFLARRDALGVARQNRLLQISGTDVQNFQVIVLQENCGVESQESVAVWRDTAYFLWKDGVYRWNDSGVKNVSDGKVRRWFTSDDYFNRAMFAQSFAHVDPARNKYRLFLASAGSDVIDRWVELDLASGNWWGPHKTGAFSPTSVFTLPDADGIDRSIIGSDEADIWMEQEAAADGAFGIDFDVQSKAWHGGTPDIEKYWGELSILGKVQNAGTLTVTPSVGYVDVAGNVAAAAQSPISYRLAAGRERLRRIGIGKFMQLRLRHTTVNQKVELYGLEVPFHSIGRR